MAELKNNPLGSLSGKLGNMVASSWRDINYLRAGSKGSNKEATLSQVEVRTRFKMLQDFIMQIKKVVDLGFSNSYTGRSTAVNVAVKVNKDAITGVFPDLSIDYPAITLSTGSLTSCLDAKVEALPEAKIQVSWVEPGVAEAAEASDKVNILIYDVKRQAAAVYNTFLRSDYTAEVSLPASFANDEVHVWLFFSTPKGEKISKSIYVGVVTVEA
ncbi:DUF6266 family protein [Desertivirga brevis]|uniref:DUF6266 family protein n=1 Tax=Desertivirga brevis TaxID=2810310 RepID=UPI001A957974|nr:DUF6266 family protein [Pedobacter sp. SYSU D00873]